jgi:hypothetical protein
MGLVNWTVDPALFFEGHFSEPSWETYEGEIARDLLAGRTHSTQRPYNEMILNDLIFRNRPEIGTLVLGSSMAKPIHRALFPGESFYNASAFGGRIEEMLAVYELARRCGLPLRRLVLQFGNVFGERPYPIRNDFVRLAGEARSRLGLTGNEADRVPLRVRLWKMLFPPENPPGSSVVPGRLHPYDALFSPRYLQLSLQFLWNGSSSDAALEGKLPIGDRHLIYPDGSVEWSSNWRAKSQADTHKANPRSVIGVIETESMRPVAGECRVFEAFVFDALRSGIAVEIVLSPPNPWLFEYARKQFESAGRILPSAETETYLRSFAAQHRLRVHGSFDPRRTRVKEDDFVDYVHLRREAIGLLF